MTHANPYTRRGGLRPPAKLTGDYWPVFAGLAATVQLWFLYLAFYSWPAALQHCEQAHPGSCAEQHKRADDGYSTFWLLISVEVGVGIWLGVRDGRRRTRFAQGRPYWAALTAVFAAHLVAAYAAGFLVGKRLPMSRRYVRAVERHERTRPKSVTELVYSAPDPLAGIQAIAGQAYGWPGGHVGWDGWGHYVGAEPRGGMLVLGPPGSGKSSGVIIPSILVAPGATVSSSIKADTMLATAKLRATVGACWHFDPGGAERPAPGVLSCRWSPLVSMRGWDDARRVASRMAEPMRGNNGTGGGDDGGTHFTDRARDWLEVLLFAAHLDGATISDVADWAHTADQPETSTSILAVLIFAADGGDPGARIARRQLEGLLTTPDRERGSIKSTLARLLRIYGSVAARHIGEQPNFDPHAFVRSRDTLYLTATPDRQAEYAPLLAGLLEEIRYAVYARHRAEEDGREPRRPHVTFALDEANNTAPVPLPAIVSEAGGQSLHVIVGIQDLSRARARWGREADGFLTLFPTKLVLHGVIEPYTVNALSEAAGEFDRQMVSTSRSYTPISMGQYGSVNVPTWNPTYSIQRQRVLHPGDISNLPVGTGLLWQGARWGRITLGMHWRHPVWQRVLASTDPPTVADTVAVLNQAAAVLAARNGKPAGRWKSRRRTLRPEVGRP